MTVAANGLVTFWLYLGVTDPDVTDLDVTDPDVTDPDVTWS